MWGGQNRAARRMQFRTLSTGSATVTVRRGRHVVHRFTLRRTGLRVHHLRLRAGRLPRGLHRITFSARSGRVREARSVVSRKL